jgi:hypothetical protein
MYNINFLSREKCMKKLLLTITAICCISIIIPHNVYAFDITAGLTTWYAWWDIDQGKDRADIDPAFLFGPAIAAKLDNDFNLTFVFLYGKYDYKGSEYDSGVYKDNIKTKRIDSDLALNYKLDDYFKVFAGLKYMSYSKDKNIGAEAVPSATPSQSGSRFNIGSDHFGIGPGIGATATVPIYDNIFLLATLSGFYLWGDEEVNPSFGGRRSYKIDLTEYGFNTTLSAAYYISGWSTVVSLGGRFQYFITHYDEYIHVRHMFYGFTLTATYSFSI